MAVTAAGSDPTTLSSLSASPATTSSWLSVSPKCNNGGGGTDDTCTVSAEARLASLGTTQPTPLASAVRGSIQGSAPRPTASLPPSNAPAPPRQGLLAPSGMSQRQQYEYYRNLITQAGGTLTPNGATVLAIRGQSVGGGVHRTTSARSYDDSFVVLGQDGQVTVLPAATHSAQTRPAFGKAPGMIRPGSYLVAPHDPHNGMPSYQVLNLNGHDGLLGFRDYHENGYIDPAERAYDVAHGTTVKGILIHTSKLRGQPTSVGCLVPKDQGRFIQLVGGPGKTFHMTLLDANDGARGSDFVPTAVASGPPQTVGTPVGGAPVTQPGPSRYTLRNPAAPPAEPGAPPPGRAYVPQRYASAAPPSMSDATDYGGGPSYAPPSRSYAPSSPNFTGSPGPSPGGVPASFMGGAPTSPLGGLGSLAPLLQMFMGMLQGGGQGMFGGGPQGAACTGGPGGLAQGGQQPQMMMLLMFFFLQMMMQSFQRER